MKKKSNKIKKAKLPIEEMTGREKDYVGAVLEEVRSNFSAFGESLDIFRQKTNDNFKRIDDSFERLENKIDIVSEKCDATFEEVGRMKVEMSEMNISMDNIEQEVMSIKNEINALKTILTQKADIEFLKKLEARLVVVERHLKLSVA